MDDKRLEEMALEWVAGKEYGSPNDDCYSDDVFHSIAGIAYQAGFRACEQKTKKLIRALEFYARADVSDNDLAVQTLTLYKGEK